MRIYLPLSAEPRASLETAAGTATPRIPLDAGTRGWAVSGWAQAGRPDEDAEDLEYDALQDAVYVALGEPDAQDPATATADPRGARVAVLAGDVPDAVVIDASQDGGAFGVAIQGSATIEVASVHVTELGARAVRESDTDPALLWFDRSEVAAALDYSDARSA